MKKLSNTEAELKKSIAYKQKTYMSYAINVEKPLNYNRESSSFLSDNKIK